MKKRLRDQESNRKKVEGSYGVREKNMEVSGFDADGIIEEGQEQYSSGNSNNNNLSNTDKYVNENKPEPVR